MELKMDLKFSNYIHRSSPCKLPAALCIYFLTLNLILMGTFNIISLNFSRFKNLGKINEIKNSLEKYNYDILCCQEIDIDSALVCFGNTFQTIVNWDLNAQHKIGTAIIIKKGININDYIVGCNGRLIGIKVENMQIWNLYPPSGSEFRKEREKFFIEKITSHMILWKDESKYIFQAGDFNCTHRKEDSKNNPDQHISNGLLKHMKIHGLKDGFLECHGKDKIEYSRVTKRSATRIDYILSNDDRCSNFQYIDLQKGLDHKCAMAEYQIDITRENERIPKRNFFQTWVIDKGLAVDDIFLESVENIYNMGKDEIKDREKKGEDLDIEEYWDIMKKEVIRMAKIREREIREQQDARKYYLEGRYRIESEKKTLGNLEI